MNAQHHIDILRHQIKRQSIQIAELVDRNRQLENELMAVQLLMNNLEGTDNQQQTEPRTFPAKF